MKPLDFLRNTLFLTIPVCIVLSGCTAAQPETDFAPQLGESYSVEAEMSYGDDQTAQLTLTRMGSGLWEAAFADPATLAGVILTFDGNAVSASYKGLEFTVPKSALPAKNMLVLATGALDAIASAGQIPCTQQEDGTWTTAGESEGGSYTMTFTVTGEPAVFDMPSQPLRLVFSDYKLITGSTDGTSSGTETTVSTFASASETSVGKTDTTAASTETDITENEGTS